MAALWQKVRIAVFGGMAAWLLASLPVFAAEPAVVISTGDDSLSAAMGSLDLKSAKTNRAPISLRVGLSKLLPLADNTDPTILELSKPAFQR